MILGPGAYGRQPINISLERMFLFLPSTLFSPLSESNEKISLGEDIKTGFLSVCGQMEDIILSTMGGRAS